MFQIRRNVFETNSSSVHSLTMCTEDQYNEWEANKTVLCFYSDFTFITLEEAKRRLRNSNWYKGPDPEELEKEELEDALWEEDMYTYDSFWDKHDDFETFKESCTTPNGETVVAFGYYGHD